MTALEWHNAVDVIRPYVVKIATPRGSGTGFLFGYAGNPDLCAIATAAHVVDQSHHWEEPIRLYHYESGKTNFTRREGRAIVLDEKIDSAAIIVPRGELELPNELLDLAPEGQALRVGIEVGWVGFPAVASDSLCYFSGRISSFVQSESAYLVDGVAINGVSGGPAIHLMPDGSVHIIGVVSAYIPNRATGDALPGLSVVRDVVQLQQLVRSFKSLEDAHDKETPPEDVESASTGDDSS